MAEDTTIPVSLVLANYRAKKESTNSTTGTCCDPSGGVAQAPLSREVIIAPQTEEVKDADGNTICHLQRQVIVTDVDALRGLFEEDRRILLDQQLTDINTILDEREEEEELPEVEETTLIALSKVESTYKNETVRITLTVQEATS